MSFVAKFNASSIMQALRARNDFEATCRITLGDWKELDAASWWCEEQWRDEGLHYRRRVFAAEDRAIFEFGDFAHGIVFLMRFGVRCQNL